jgi:hypothetical protein
MMADVRRDVTHPVVETTAAAGKVRPTTTSVGWRRSGEANRMTTAPVRTRRRG